MFNPFDPEPSVLIERETVRGVNMLMLRKADEQAPTQVMESQPAADPIPPWPVIDCSGLPNDRRLPILRLPIITRIRAALARWIAPR